MAVTLPPEKPTSKFLKISDWPYEKFIEEICIKSVGLIIDKDFSIKSAFYPQFLKHVDLPYGINVNSNSQNGG